MPRPRRVAIVAAGPDIVGGHSVQAQALVRALCADGTHARLIPINPAFPPGLRWVRRVPYVRTLLNQLAYVPGLARLASMDVVHVFSASYASFLLGPLPAMIAARLARARVVLHYHSGEADDHLGRWGMLVHPWLRLAHEIVVPSEYLANVFRRHGYTARVIANVVDVSELTYRERLSVAPRLLSARNLEPYYRVDVLLDAFLRVKAQFPEATLTVAGSGSQEAALRARAPEGVRFVGSASRCDMARLYAGADILINASEVDNQPVTILEAFAAGLPVVSTPAGDIPAMVDHGRTGLLVPCGDAAAIADAVARLVREPGLAATLARSARAALDRFTWHAVRREWDAVYAGTTDRAGTGPAFGRAKALRLRT